MSCAAPTEIATIGMAGPTANKIVATISQKWFAVLLTPAQDKEEPLLIQLITKHSDQHHVEHHSFTQHPTESGYKEILQKHCYNYT